VLTEVMKYYFNRYKKNYSPVEKPTYKTRSAGNNGIIPYNG